MWDWIVLLLVIYTAIFTPYVAAFLLNEYDYNSKKTKGYGEDPIVIIDLLGMPIIAQFDNNGWKKEVVLIIISCNVI